MKESVVLALILTLFFVWTFLSQQVSAQTRARTESGKEVILCSDGTWKYAEEIEVSLAIRKEFLNDERMTSNEKIFPYWLRREVPGSRLVI
jgi:regulatory protein YycI of two-component signal transduction system YycFG